MNDWPPRRTIRLQVNLSGRKCPGNEIVQDNVEALPRRQTVCSCRTQVNRTKAVARQTRDVTLRHYLRLAVRRHRVESATLINHRLACLTIVAARGSEYETTDARLFRELRYSNTRTMINLVRKAWFEISERII